MNFHRKVHPAVIVGKTSTLIPPNNSNQGAKKEADGTTPLVEPQKEFVVL